MEPTREIPPDASSEPTAAPTSGPSFGNVGPHHWSRARAGENAEAIDYYQKRSKAPGVKSGGGARNYYCMSCDGVIDFDRAPTHCPHCNASLEEGAKRYFNWVELNDPAPSDFKALLPVFALVGVVMVVLLAALVWWLS